jgi:hypothetical protein
MVKTHYGGRMTVYIKAGPVLGDTLDLHGRMEQVTDPKEATLMSFSDADYICKQAQKEWPGSWRSEKVGDRYVVKSER